MKSPEHSEPNIHNFIYAVSEGKLSSHSNPNIEIRYIIEQGITKAGLQALAISLSWDIDMIAKAIGTTRQTLIRYKNKRLNKKISENALEVARLCEFGVTYFGSVDGWNQWLDSVNIKFDGQPPRSFIDSIRGRELIQRTINALQHGLLA